MSQTQTLAPIAAKALAISFPMPEAPAVTNTRYAAYVSPVLVRSPPSRLIWFNGPSGLELPDARLLSIKYLPLLLLKGCQCWSSDLHRQHGDRPAIDAIDQ